MAKTKKEPFAKLVDCDTDEPISEVRKRLENYLQNLIFYYEDFKTVNSNRWAKRAMLIEIQDVRKQINSILVF